jgi:hypothetical protein
MKDKPKAGLYFLLVSLIPIIDVHTQKMHSDDIEYKI